MSNQGLRSYGWERGTAPGSIRVRVGGTTVATFDDATNDLVLPTNGLTVTAGGITVTAGNANLGGAPAFATTQPDMALILNSGTAPAGAIVTAGGVFASDTVVRKIIAAGTVSNVET